VEAGPLEHLDRPELLAQLWEWNRELARYSAEPIITNHAAENLPLIELRSVLSSTANRLAQLGSLLNGGPGEKSRRRGHYPAT
jgi:hypothetical protein